MAFREVLVTEVKEVLRAWLAGLGKRPAAARAGVNVKTAARYIRAAQEAGLDRGGGEGQLTDDLIGAVVGAVRPARPARALRSCGLVAEESAEADGVARVLVITPTGAQLAERVYAVAQDGKLWFWWSGEPLCPADDIGTAADKIAHMLRPTAIRA